MKRIGIRHEDKYAMERRCAITPDLMKKLIEQGEDVGFFVEKSEKRIFKGHEFENIGAHLVDDVRDCDVVFGIKEISESFFRKGKTYVFFSHVIKGQAYNMPMLRKMMEMGCNLIDYEKVEDETGKRLIFFGKYAGLAGMINSLWSLGLRLKEFGFSTPFEKINQAVTYDSLEDVKKVISEVGFEIVKNGLPDELFPFVIGFTGYGNVSAGAQEIFNLLPVKEISPEKLLELSQMTNLPHNVLYKVVFKEKDLVKPIDSSHTFELQDYYKNPEKYCNDFEKYVPHLSILMNCMYWDAKYPRLITKDFLEDHFKKIKQPKLMVIGDVTCDPNGSIEALHKGTEIEDPIFVYHPFTRKYSMGYKGDGILIMAVDILPSELPRESSTAFSNALSSYILPIALADFDVPFSNLKLPNPIKRALILHKGKLTPAFKYIEKFLNP
ncbi:MAG: hypothetical protein PHT69_11515 [Bacteroidales bacterium]|nr:hypothetical protein [Bacteroidales bacterium]